MFKWLKRKREVKKHDKSYCKNPITVPKSIKPKQGIRYSCRVKYKNREEEHFTLIMDNADSLVNAVFSNHISQLTDGKIIYINSDEILKFIAEEEK